MALLRTERKDSNEDAGNDQPNPIYLGQPTQPVSALNYINTHKTISLDFWFHQIKLLQAALVFSLRPTPTQHSAVRNFTRLSIAA